MFRRGQCVSMLKGDKMQDLDQTGKTTWRYQLMAIARDTLTVSAVVSLLATVAWFFVRPYALPFLTLPEKVAEINARLAPLSSPELVEFRGSGLLVNGSKFTHDGTVRIMYNLRRNADCATEVEYSFVNANTGSKVTTGTGRAVQAPVTEGFTYFILNLPIPDSLLPGKYSYFPRITPMNCGIYKTYNGAMSEIFEVTND